MQSEDFRKKLTELGGNTSRPIVIMLDKAELSKSPSLFSDDFWTVFEIVANIVTTCVGLPGAGTALAEGLKIAAEVAIPLIRSGLQIAASIESITRDQNAGNISSNVISMLGSGLQAAILMSDVGSRGTSTIEDDPNFVGPKLPKDEP